MEQRHCTPMRQETWCTGMEQRTAPLRERRHCVHWEGTETLHPLRDRRHGALGWNRDITHKERGDTVHWDGIETLHP